MKVLAEIVNGQKVGNIPAFGVQPTLDPKGGLSEKAAGLAMTNPLVVKDVSQSITEFIPKATTEQYGVIKAPVQEYVDFSEQLVGTGKLFAVANSAGYHRYGNIITFTICNAKLNNPVTGITETDVYLPKTSRQTFETGFITKSTKLDFIGLYYVDNRTNGRLSFNLNTVYSDWITFATLTYIATE